MLSAAPHRKNATRRGNERPTRFGGDGASFAGADLGGGASGGRGFDTPTTLSNLADQDHAPSLGEQQC